MVQFAEAATLEPQVLVSLNGAVAVMPLIFRVVLPLFVRVTDCGALGVPTGCDEKLRLAGFSKTRAAALPFSGTVCGLPAALSATDTAALAGPGAVGVKVTLIVQVPFAATVVPHVLVWLNSPPPTILMLLIFRMVLEVLVKVIFCAGLLLPTFPVKFRTVGLKVTLIPVPIMVTESVLLAVLSTA